MSYKCNITCECGKEVDTTEMMEILNRLTEENKEVEKLRFFKENVIYFIKAIESLK